MKLRPDQIESINRHQADQRFHPLTCGSGRRTDVQHADGEGRLVATEDGMVCPFCGWRQLASHPTVQRVAKRPEVADNNAG